MNNAKEVFSEAKVPRAREGTAWWNDKDCRSKVKEMPALGYERGL